MGDQDRTFRFVPRAGEFIFVVRLRVQSPKPQGNRRSAALDNLVQGTGSERVRNHGDDTRNRVI